VSEYPTGVRAEEHDHLVSFYDGEAGLIDALTGFFVGGLEQGAAAVVVATDGHRRALEQALSGRGFSLDELRASGRYQSFDARQTLDLFMCDAAPDPAAFQAAISPIIATAAAAGRSVRIFGEMVALLWDDGNVAGAIELEAMWNDVRTQQAFTLYCAYPMSALEGTADLGDAKRVCDAHSHVSFLPEGLGSAPPLANDDSAFVRSFVPTLAAPRAARQFAAAALRALGEEGLTHVAVLITSELATNAIAHGRSPFTVTISPTGSTIEIAVRDASARRPRLRRSDASHLGGRGIALVASIAADWGTRTEPDGKAVWATLTRVSDPGSRV
jgi:anti-sigma regulatory factor (Ser/Thr protein kinase)